MDGDLFTYGEALNKIENFMIDSGIRKFCSEVCKGRCCLGCYESEKSCVKNEGRRLSCSIWVCNEMLNLIFSERDKLRITILRDKITEDLQYWMNALSYHRKNVYFNPHSEYVMKNFRINKKFVNFLDSIDIKNIKRKIICLCSIVKKTGNKR
jgi:hypothetical protein